MTAPSLDEKIEGLIKEAEAAARRAWADGGNVTEAHRSILRSLASSVREAVVEEAERIARKYGESGMVNNTAQAIRALHPHQPKSKRLKLSVEVQEGYEPLPAPPEQEEK
jgi:hypothetical protein